MTKECVIFNEVVFLYDSSSLPVFDGLSVRLGVGWTGIIGPNGSGKTTFLRLACGKLIPLRGSVNSPDKVIYCPQRTDQMPPELEAFVKTNSHIACTLRGQLKIQEDWVSRWETLSHGERKRAQIAVALWQQPRVLAIDEPTNHIDLEARQLLAEALRSFRGIGLLISHDRDMLDNLCRQTLFIELPNAILRPGGYTKALELAKAEQQRSLKLRTKAKRKLTKLQREISNRAREAVKSNRKRSKRGLSPKDHDARFVRGLARYSGKDGQAGRKLRQLNGRQQRAQAELANTYVKKQQQLGINICGERSGRNTLFRLPAGSIKLGNEVPLVFPELSITPQDRIAIIGSNGSGKSTLIQHIVNRLDLPEQKFVYIPQEIDRLKARQIVNSVRNLPKIKLGDAMTFVSCLGSDPQCLMETAEPSPGELRKLMLAVGMADQPHLIVMDEPTNHLDLPSINCLESALNNCVCSLLLVSHDLRFLQKLCRTCWEITLVEDNHDNTKACLVISNINNPPLLKKYGKPYQ
ncbi:ATP-binding cassette domain-containing protein [Planctomycetota bacterium]